MLASSAFSRGSSATIDNRVFLFEVSGMAQSDQTRDQAYSIRESGTCVYQVPFSNMNNMMQRFNRLGCKIVSIKSMGDSAASSSQGETAE